LFLFIRKIILNKLIYNILLKSIKKFILGDLFFRESSLLSTENFIFFDISLSFSIIKELISLSFNAPEISLLFNSPEIS
jgi:hypothetical protein